VIIVAMAVGLALGIQAFVVKPYQIPSESMEPTLDVGQRILVNRFLYRFSDPDIGDIVVFHPPQGADNGGMQCGVPTPTSQPCPQPTKGESDQNFVKRIVAGPGDTLSVQDGHPVVNGEIADNEDFIRECRSDAPSGNRGGDGKCNFPDTITIPDDHYFMMGDNRGQSTDSRYWGPVPKDWIIGKAFATYWPPKRIGVF
jgi:signal peptidase I